MDELLKTRERIHECFTSLPVDPRKVSSSNNDGKEVVGEPTVSTDESGSPITEEGSADKATKSKKWFNLNFKTSMTSTSK